MSSQRSKRGAPAAKAKGGRAAAARPAGGRGVFVQKPRSDAYVALLGIALGALVLGSLFLVLHLWQYEFKLSAAANAPILSATA